MSAAARPEDGRADPAVSERHRRAHEVTIQQSDYQPTVPHVFGEDVLFQCTAQATV